MNSQRKIKLGQLLREKAYLDESQLKVALAEQSVRHRRLGEILLELGYITQAQLNEALALQVGIERIDLTDVLVTADLPSFMTYQYFPGYFPSPTSSSSNHLEWYLGTLPPGPFCRDIRYNAVIDSAGVEGDKYAFVIANYGFNPVSDSDSVHVIVE